LGLTLIAAPQLGERSRLNIVPASQLEAVELFQAARNR
jgi:hypothetical protein